MLSFQERVHLYQPLGYGVIVAAVVSLPPLFTVPSPVNTKLAYDIPLPTPCSRVAACSCNDLGKCISNINSGGQYGQIVINQMNIQDALGQIRAVNAPVQTGGPWTMADFQNNDYFIYQGQTYLAITSIPQSDSNNCPTYKHAKGCPKPTSDIPLYTPET